MVNTIKHGFYTLRAEKLGGGMWGVLVFMGNKPQLVYSGRHNYISVEKSKSKAFQVAKRRVEELD